MMLHWWPLPYVRHCTGPIHTGSSSLVVTLSIGISLFPEDGEEADSLLAHADAAMYRVKTDGRDNLRFYSAQKIPAISDRSRCDGGCRARGAPSRTACRNDWRCSAPVATCIALWLAIAGW